jgi:hypothetical protein
MPRPFEGPIHTEAPTVRAPQVYCTCSPLCRGAASADWYRCTPGCKACKPDPWRPPTRTPALEHPRVEHA